MTIDIVQDSTELNLKGIYYFMKYRASPFSPLFVPYVFNTSDALLASIWIGVAGCLFIWYHIGKSRHLFFKEHDILLLLLL